MRSLYYFILFCLLFPLNAFAQNDNESEKRAVWQNYEIALTPNLPEEVNLSIPLKYNLGVTFNYLLANSESWTEEHWKAEVNVRLVRVKSIYQDAPDVVFPSEVELTDQPDIFENIGTVTLSLHQHLVDNTLPDQLFTDFVLLNEIPFTKENLIKEEENPTEGYKTVLLIESLVVWKGSESNVITDEQELRRAFELTLNTYPTARYGKIGDMQDDVQLTYDYNGSVSLIGGTEQLEWAAIENATRYDVEWVFIDKYDLEYITITDAEAAFSYRRGVRVQTKNLHYKLRPQTELTYPDGKVFFRVRGVGKYTPPTTEENPEIKPPVTVVGNWNYSPSMVEFVAGTSTSVSGYYTRISSHQSDKNWQYATVFAEDGKYKKVMSYFDASLNSTQTLTNFSTDTQIEGVEGAISNQNGSVTLVQENFYDYEGRAVVQTIPAPLHTSSLAYKSIAQAEGVNYFEGGKAAYDKGLTSTPSRLGDGSLTSKYYSAASNEANANDPSNALINFSKVDRFKHNNYIPISDGYAYTQVKYTNDGTGRVRMQSGLGETFAMGNGHEMKTFYLNPAQEELTRLFGPSIGDVSHYKKILSVDPNGQKSVVYMDQAGQAIATALVGSPTKDEENNSPLRLLEDNQNGTVTLDLMRNNMRKGLNSSVSYKFYSALPNTVYTIDYSLRGAITELALDETETKCLSCHYDLKLYVVNKDGEKQDLYFSPTLVQGDSESEYIRTITPNLDDNPNNNYTEQDVDNEDEELGDRPDWCVIETNSEGEEVYTNAVNVENVTRYLKGGENEEYTLIKELVLISGDGKEMQNLIKSQMETVEGDFILRSDIEAGILADQSCTECTQVVEEDGTVTQTGNCGDEILVGSSPAEMASNASLLVDQQCASLRTQFENNWTATTPIEYPNCLTCEENTDATVTIKDSRIYDLYMSQSLPTRTMTSALSAPYLTTTSNFTNPFANDPFWELNSVGESIVRTMWNLYQVQGLDGGTVTPQSIIDQVGVTIYNDPSYTVEEIDHMKWLVFFAYYQSFKAEKLKEYYNNLGCTEAALNLLLPANNIDVVGNYNDYQNEGSEIWEAFSSADCPVWAEDRTSILSAQLADCPNWDNLTEAQTIALEASLEEKFENYCSGDPLDETYNTTNAFKLIYYEPTCVYPIFEDPNYAQVSLIEPTTTSYDLVVAFDNFLASKPIYAIWTEVLNAQFDGTNTEIGSYFGYTEENWNEIEPSVTLAYIELALRAATPYNEIDCSATGIGQTQNTALDEMKTEILSNGLCLEPFYAMLTPTPCKSYTEDEVWVKDTSIDPLLLDADGKKFVDGLQFRSNVAGVRGKGLTFNNDEFYDNLAIGKTTEAIINLQTSSDPTGTKYPIVSVIPRRVLDYPIDRHGLEFGVKKGNNDNYYLYYTSYKRPANMSLQETEYVSSTPLNIQLGNSNCMHVAFTTEFLPRTSSDDGNGNVSVIGDIEVTLWAEGQVVGSNIMIQNTDGNLIGQSTADYIGQSDDYTFNGIIQEVRIWDKKIPEFLYQDEKLPTYFLNTPVSDTKLLGYWRLRYENGSTGGLVKDLSQNQNHINVSTSSGTPQDPPLSALVPQYVESTCIKEVPMILKTVRMCSEYDEAVEQYVLNGDLTTEDLLEACKNAVSIKVKEQTDRILGEQVEVLSNIVTEKYKNDCFKKPYKETLTLSFENSEYHYTLYYYDQAGNLVQTVQPAGVKTDGSGNHDLITKYQYNTLGQVVWQESPDAKEATYWFDYYGRVRLSQNAEQKFIDVTRNKTHYEYSYSKYDELGKPYEVGKLSTTDLIEETTCLNELILDSQFPKNIENALVLQADGVTEAALTLTLSERTRTYYDNEEVRGINNEFIVNPNEQLNLQYRISSVVTLEEDETTQNEIIGSLTRYSYDVHGNVTQVWQKLPREAGIIDEKITQYDYDLLSGNVNEVCYQKGEDDEFRHHYTYDGDNRLTQVHTSLDGFHWTLEAKYYYYAHGPLARVEVGKHQVQGTDYFYTLQGWLKGVNAIGLQAQDDLGKDGHDDLANENAKFNRDEFAFALNYYQGDYVANRGNAQLGEAFLQNEDYTNFTGFKDELGANATYKRQSLYNGTIVAMSTSIGSDNELSTQSMNYRYDQLHRIAAAEAVQWKTTGTSTTKQWIHTAGTYRTSYKYDKNGNITDLHRRNKDTQEIDKLDYKYGSGNFQNRLLEVEDDLTGIVANEGISVTQDYKYDEIGNVIQNIPDGLKRIEWNSYGKVEQIIKTNGEVIIYKYDSKGKRIVKSIIQNEVVVTTSYVRNATGNIMAMYENRIKNSQSITRLQEMPIYGSTVLGHYRPKKIIDEQGNEEFAKKTALGQRIYEFSNHLGNVLVTITDNKVMGESYMYVATVFSSSDYYPFGMAMKGRTFNQNRYKYGFNGQEKSTELDDNGNSYSAEYWQYDARTGRRWNVDPVNKPWESSYATFRNNPIFYSDPNGDDPPEGFRNYRTPGGGKVLLPISVGENAEKYKTGKNKGAIKSFDIDGNHFQATYNFGTGKFSRYVQTNGHHIGRPYKNPDIIASMDLRTTGDGNTGIMNAAAIVENVPMDGLEVIQLHYSGGFYNDQSFNTWYNKVLPQYKGTSPSVGQDKYGFMTTTLQPTLRKDGFQYYNHHLKKWIKPFSLVEVDGGFPSQHFFTVGRETVIGQPYYNGNTFPSMIYGDNDQGMIVTGDAPFIDDQHWTFFTTIIVAKNYYGTGKDIILATFHWGWRRRGNVIAPVGHGGTVGSSKTILPSVMSEADYRAINHYYQNYLLFR